MHTSGRPTPSVGARPEAAEQSAASDSSCACQLRRNQGLGSEPLLWRLRRWTRQTRKALGMGERLRAVLSTCGLRHPPTANEPIPLEPIRDLQAGDWVRVRPRRQIEQTLDSTGRLRGCAILEPMFAWCDKPVRVARIVERFFDEKEWRMRRCKGIVLLEGVYCDGSGHPDTMGCDRMCFFFWRTEWLERAAQSPTVPVP